MVVASLTVQGLVQLTIGASFLLVGYSVRGRPATSPGGALARGAFLAWWYGLGTFLALLGVDSLAGAIGAASYDLLLFVAVVKIPFLAASLWGMMTYVAFMWTGRTGAWRPAAIYAGALAVGHYASLFMNTDGIIVADFHTGLRPIDPQLMIALYAAFTVPLLGSLAAYGALVRRAQNAEQRYRIVMVTASLSLWVAGAFVGAASGDANLGFITVCLLGLATAMALILAYRPPRWVLRQLTHRVARSERGGIAAWGPEPPH